MKETTFKRLFSRSVCRDMGIRMGEMSFAQDFVDDPRGDLYPILSKSEDCSERVAEGHYYVRGGEVKRFFMRYFPYASYRIIARSVAGAWGFCFRIPGAETSILADSTHVICLADGNEQKFPLPAGSDIGGTMEVCCRPGAFDVYFTTKGTTRFLGTYENAGFARAHHADAFSNGCAALHIRGDVTVESVLARVDNGIAVADPRPIRYEDGSIMTEGGRVYLTASVRMVAGGFQGIYAWVPGTAELEFTGALFYDAGDGLWAPDVAASVLYHRERKEWLLWVCSFSHGHILGHAAFDGDIRHGINVVDLTLMEKAPDGTDPTEFLGFFGDEDPDFYYDRDEGAWYMAICRLDPDTHRYRYRFFRSQEGPFTGYRFIGQGDAGEETGGSFVKLGGERAFLCGNGFALRSNYRIYRKTGWEEASFDYPDGGFRGWGTVIPVKLGSRERVFWLTFDRHRASDFNWSYGNLYCFEADR